jgi:hypothetical protein
MKVKLCGPYVPTCGGATCEYANCHGPGVGELRAHNLREHGPWIMCAEHIKPEAHPPDLRDKLHRWHRWHKPPSRTEGPPK